ncbi:hypothetical protein TNCV_2396231 [Trichonephila clavipes]|uniref:Uncharacterized protein n=1 Tax=Trichonephila clavipes TaxID=2585209 RepID=A0A8X6VM42_TRICX|nr:hypothetical protein TNCV_2396231 [Trichonephila clavipes]
MVCAQQTKIPGVNITEQLQTVKYMNTKNTLPSEMPNCIKNVYWELPTPNLLAKCLHGIFPGFYPARAMETADRERLRKANYNILQNSKEERVKKGIRKSENVCFKKFPARARDLKNKHVPLHNLSGFKLRSRITNQPIFKQRLCGDIPNISKEFKNVLGKFTGLISSPIVSIDLKGIGSPGHNSTSGS